MKNSLLSGFLVLIAGYSLTGHAELLSLSDLRSKVLDDNLDIQIQYENYYQAQRNIGVAMGELLPKLSINLFFFNSTYGILQTVVPTPSGWFKYQASKDLARAEEYTNISVKLNILEGLTNNYIEIKKNEKALLSLKEQEIILEEVYNDAVTKEQLGIGTQEDSFLAERKLRQLRQDIFILNSLIVSEKEALLIAINRSPSEELELAELPELEENIPATISEAQEIAVLNSSEIISNFFLGKAASDMVSSARWSFVSFDGIGFGYPSQLAIEKSKAREIGLLSQKTENKIYNQIHVNYKELEILDKSIENQKMILMLTKKTLDRQIDLYNGGVITLKSLSESKISYISEDRNLTNLEMEYKVKINEIKRLLGNDVALINLDLDTYKNAEVSKEVIKETSRKIIYNFSLDLSKEELQNIYSVDYSVDGMFQGESLKVTSQDSKFSYTLKLKDKRTYFLNLKIQLVNGMEILKKLKIEYK